MSEMRKIKIVQAFIMKTAIDGSGYFSVVYYVVKIMLKNLRQVFFSPSQYFVEK